MRREKRLLPAGTSPESLSIDWEALRRLFDRPGIVAAYLFGSMAEDRATPLSDVDLAYLADSSGAEERLFDPLYEGLQRLVGEGRFDLVPLRRAPLHIQYQLATEGRVLLCRDPVLEERFRARAITYYLDFKPYRDAYFASGP